MHQRGERERVKVERHIFYRVPQFKCVLLTRENEFKVEIDIKKNKIGELLICYFGAGIRFLSRIRILAKTKITVELF